MTSPARLNPNYGRGEVTLDDLSGPIDSNELSERIGTLFSRPGFKIPMLPAMAVEVMKTSRKPQLRIDELVEVIARDAMIAADVLKLARSPLYATLTPARTLKEAALRLGISGVQSVVLETLQRVIFKSPTMGPALDAVRRHGATVAHLSRLVARQTSIDAEFAFLCGLLHDIGLSAGLVALGQDQAAVLDPHQWAALEQTHERAAGLLARLWQLAPEVALVLAHHHATRSELPKVHPAVAVVAIAERLASDHGQGLVQLLAKAKLPLLQSDEIPEPSRTGAARAVLGLNDATFTQLHKSAGALLEHLAQAG